MGNLTVLLAGDFRQILPVVARGTPLDELNACLKASYLWNNITKLKLTKNLRVALFSDELSGNFTNQLLNIGEDKFKTDQQGKIHFTEEFCNIVQSTDELIDKVFPNVYENFVSKEWLCQRAILAPTNDTVSNINNLILEKIPGDAVTVTSLDTVVNSDDITAYPTEFLNSLDMPGVPSHKIKLKIGVSIILMRNLDAPRLCNGTRLRVTRIGTHIITAEILTGSAKGEIVLIPQIPIIPNDLPFQFRRLQFPIKLAFAITINKAQGQTMKFAGVDLTSPCFSHGQLYVACSRVSNGKNLYILAPNGTYNVVYHKVLQN